MLHRLALAVAACPFLLAPAAAACALLTPDGPLQDPAADPLAAASAAQRPALERASEGARAAWLRLVAAEGARDGAPVDAFHLRAEVRNRDGVRTNDLKVEYRYLAPHFIRFALPNEGGTVRRETGRGPGVGQRAYWLKDGDEVRELIGREATEDRRLVDEMLVVARNFLAFSDLANLRLEHVGLAAAPPADLPASWRTKPWWRKLTWLELESPDFALLHPERRGERPDGARSYLVQLGLDPGDGLPRLAVVREKTVREKLARDQPAEASSRSAAPLLFRLEHYQLAGDFLVPHQILVHPLLESAPGTPASGPRFAEDPTQEIYLLETELRPELSPESFNP